MPKQRKNNSGRTQVYNLGPLPAAGMLRPVFHLLGLWPWISEPRDSIHRVRLQSGSLHTHHRREEGCLSEGVITSRGTRGSFKYERSLGCLPKNHAMRRIPFLCILIAIFALEVLFCFKAKSMT